MTIDDKLNDATARQLKWKPGPCRAIATQILIHMVSRNDKIVWPDEINFSFVAEADRNCIGMTWRSLTRNGILKRTESHRRSAKEQSNGRIIWAYRMNDLERAKEFLARNDCPNPDRSGTPELPFNDHISGPCSYCGGDHWKPDCLEYRRYMESGQWKKEMESEAKAKCSKS